MRFTQSMAIFVPVVVTAAVFALLPASAQGTDAAALFNQRCKVCHTVAAGAPGTVGPNLRGVVGRKAGAAKFSYSAAMAKSGLVWNAANLDKYLAAPSKAVPGTKMVISVPDASQRKAIIGFLATQR